MNLFLFTYFFPYQKAEPFVINELGFAQKNCRSISVLSTYGQEGKCQAEYEVGLDFKGSVFSDASNKKEIFRRGIFNLAPFNFHLKEFIQKRLFVCPKKAYWFFISLLVTRAILSSKIFKRLIQKIETTERPILYFYWGDNLTWTLPYLAKIIKRTNAKVIVRLHNSDLYEMIKDNYAPLRESIFSMADSIVTISDHGKNYLVSKYPKIKDKVLVSRLGVFNRGINPEVETKELVLVSVSNVVSLKRVHLLFEALQQTNKKITWYHFGDGPLLQDLKKSVAFGREGLKVVLQGHVSNNELMGFYNNTHVDLFVNVSSAEGLPVSIMEALSFGIPVIATNVGGVSELVNKNVGELIDPDFRSGHLSNLIDAFYNKPQHELTELRRNALLMFRTKVEAKENYGEFYKFLSLLHAA